MGVLFSMFVKPTKRKLIKIHDLIQIQNFKTSLYVWEDPKKKKNKTCMKLEFMKFEFQNTTIESLKRYYKAH